MESRARKMGRHLDETGDAKQGALGSLDAAEEALLVRYASGNLNPAPSLLVATHLALRPDRRAYVGDLEALGGALLEALPPSEVSDDLREAVFARLDVDDYK
eukprot:TRINITY_DN38452_c0_g1_i10.p4 TRINITY_DN38452_c0_g1~~TRINITY_DN38452_c0_g1_i10.p4  ORF type:complete len:102 (-),score=13.37 TRINITY_DN38452_c0_g1_i10:184-489(-)